MRLSEIVNLVERIEDLTDAEIKKINDFLKMDESDLRITKTEISQMKEMGSQALAASWRTQEGVEEVEGDG